MKMNEIWKKVVLDGVEYNYLVSNLGRVKSLHNNIILKQGDSAYGYKLVTLSKHNETRTIGVHRLVAIMFIPNPQELPVVNHKDENKTNNCVDNLEWCTVKYNTNYGTAIQRRSEKITGKQRQDKMTRVICLETQQIFDSCKDAANWCGVHYSLIGGCCSGKRKSAGKHPTTRQKLHWMYYEEYLQNNG